MEHEADIRKPFKFTPYQPSMLDDISFGGCPGEIIFQSVAVVEKLAESTYDKKPQQYIYEKRAWKRSA
jgi:hypothetical protein